jgi:hypothetical protein
VVQFRAADEIPQTAAGNNIGGMVMVVVVHRYG